MSAQGFTHHQCDLSDLDTFGAARIPGLLTTEQCKELISLWDGAVQYRKKVDMGEKGYGRGHYRYFADPLPTPIARLREYLYPPLAAVANRWARQLGTNRDYPATLAEYLRICASAGQEQSTPLLLRYGPGDWNALHQDIYGKECFPLQVVIMLSRPESDFTGGELLLTEQVNNSQARPEVVPLTLGDAAIIPTHLRPVAGSNGVVAAQMYHGVSRVTSGQRMTCGIIFHNAA